MTLSSEIDALTHSKVRLTTGIGAFEQAIAGLGSEVGQAAQELDQVFDQGLADTKLFAADATDSGVPPFALSNDLGEKVESLLVSIHEIDERVEGISEKLDALASAIDDAQTRFDEGLASLNGLLVDRVDYFSAALNEQGEVLTNGFDTMRGDVEERFEEVISSVEAFLEEALLAKPQEALKDAEELFTAAFESSTDVVEDISKELAASLEVSLNELTEYVADGAETAIATAADRLMELLTDRVTAEAVDTVFEVQIGAQVTVMLQPYLPQLMVASAVAPAVQGALDVMRGGM